MKNTTTKLAALAGALLATCALVLGVALPAQTALARTLDASDAGIQVSDDITRLNVAKLDPDTREYVKGATMQIIEKDTGEVVDEWVTTDTTHKNEKSLNVNVVYILRELSAPDGFQKAKDTEFMVNETEGTGITILSGDDAELTQSYTINLYDKKGTTTNEVTYTKTNNKTTTTTTSKVKAPKTADETPILAVSAAVVVCLASISVIQVIKRKQAKNEA